MLQPQLPENISTSYRLEVKLIQMFEMPTEHLLVLMLETISLVSGMGNFKIRSHGVLVSSWLFLPLRFTLCTLQQLKIKTLAFK